MRVEDIHSYEDLQKYVKLELARQTLKRKTIELELPEEWFFKFAKLIRFSLKHDEKERGIIDEVSIDCKKYVLKVNRIFTIVKRK